jgi:hypothetical protein
MIVMIIVLDKTTDPQLNSILQCFERCEVAIGFGKRAAHYTVAVEIPGSSEAV